MQFFLPNSHFFQHVSHITIFWARQKFEGPMCRFLTFFFYFSHILLRFMWSAKIFLQNSKILISYKQCFFFSKKKTTQSLFVIYSNISLFDIIRNLPFKRTFIEILLRSQNDIPFEQLSIVVVMETAAMSRPRSPRMFRYHLQ